MVNRVLVTGGAGYIGSTISHYLKSEGIDVVVIDSLEYGDKSNLPDGVAFYHGRIKERQIFEKIREDVGSVDAVIHCASYISAPESQLFPVKYMRNNVSEFIAMLENLGEIGCRRLIFSSSASIYGTLQGEVTELSAINPQSVYANTKWLCEQISGSLVQQSDFGAINLRYFNPIGTHPDGVSGPSNIESGSLLNELTKAAINGTPFMLTGDDFETRDGTGLRDYIDVGDLARAHVQAVQYFDEITTAATLDQAKKPVAINLGTGNGVTVKEMIEATEQAIGRKLTVKLAPRREGDVPGSYTSTKLAKALLKWEARVPLEKSILAHVQWWQKKLSNEHGC